MKQISRKYSYHPKGLRKSIKQTVDKMSKLVKFDIPFSITFKKIKTNTIIARINTRLRGQLISGTGRGRSRAVALKNARKSLFSNYERSKKRYNQQALRVSKRPDESSTLMINGMLRSDTSKTAA